MRYLILKLRKAPVPFLLVTIALSFAGCTSITSEQAMVTTVPATPSPTFGRIVQGGDVFLGESRLDITLAVGDYSQVAWFAPGTSPSLDLPDYIAAVDTPYNFSVEPADFVGRTGTWYRWNGSVQGVAFRVVEPRLL